MHKRRYIEVGASVLDSQIQKDTNRFCVLSIMDEQCRLLYAVARGSTISGFLSERGTKTQAVTEAFLANQSFFSYGGLDYREEKVGTSSWTLAAQLKKPIQLVSAEQFANVFAQHNQLISALPLFNPDGSLYGTVAYCHYLDASLLDADYETCAAMDMGFLEGIAVQIESRVGFQTPLGPSNLLANKSMPAHGTIVADGDGTIISMDRKAKALLGLIKKRSVPANLESALPGYEDFCRLLVHGGRYQTHGPKPKRGNEKGPDAPEDLLTISAESYTAEATCAGGAILVRLFGDSEPETQHSENPAAPDPFEAVLGQGSKIRRTKELCRQFAQSNENILIQGEPSTGKQLMARAIHAASRPNGPFVTFNAPSIPKDLLLPSLLGYEPETVYPNRRTGSPGLVEMAHHGTLFIDELIDIPPTIQAALLRIIDDRSVARVGGSDDRPVDFRLIASTSRDPHLLIQKGLLLPDFYHCLSVLEASMPPLRERISDIGAIATHFLEQYCAKENAPLPVVDDSFFEALENCDWPGNIRQLSNAIIYAVNVAQIQGENSLKAEHLPDSVLGRKETGIHSEDAPSSMDNSEYNLGKVERQTIMRAWRKTNGDTPRMAAMLGISISTLNRRLKEYELRR